MIELLARIAVVTGLALGCAGAQAAVYSWSSHAPFETSAGIGGIVGPGNFSDFWTFSISEAQIVEKSAVVANNNPPAFAIGQGSYSLFSYGADNIFGNGDDALLNGWNFDGTTGSTEHAVGLNAGNYYFNVVGNATGSIGGIYAISSTLSPVPTPESFGLFIAGLGWFGLLARRRRRAAEPLKHSRA